QANKILADASGEAKRILGEADAKASQYYETFRKNPELAIFLMQLNALEQALKDRAYLILGTQTPPLNLLNGTAVDAAGPYRKKDRNDDPTHHGAGPTGPGPAQGAEDAGAQALAEALRSSFNVVKLLMGALVMAFIFSGVFTVKPNQVAIKLRFGSPLGAGAGQLLKPGLHWKFPYPIDDVVYVPVGESHTVSS